jgi:hypothetical protein
MNPAPSLSGLALRGLDGSNPLGFLAALGTLVTLQKSAHPHVRLGWQRGVHWIPVLYGPCEYDPHDIANAISAALHGTNIPAEDEKGRESAQRSFDAAKKAVKDKMAEIKKRKLKGAARKVAYAEEVQPLEQLSNQKRTAWLSALKRSVPSEELALGRHIDCTPSEYREHALSLVRTASHEHRQGTDFLAAFGSDAVVERSGRIRSTPFCFITGSGHQYFLDTVRQLIEQVSAERVYGALFLPWEYRDEKLSMRWDPVEDRRYALMDRDPTASDNKSRTVWMANLLAYRGLALFFSAATLRSLETTGWTEINSNQIFTWPIWEEPLSSEVIQSLMQLQELYNERLDRARVRARGIVAIFRSQRIQVGDPPLYKINFTPANSL